MIYFSDYGNAVTDPHFASTKLLLSFDGANGSTTFTDQSAAARGNATVPGSNDAQVATNHKKFGTGSLRLDGNFDKLTYADHADWTFAGDFTVEAWASFDATALDTEQNIVSHYEATDGQRAWHLTYRGALATNALQFGVSVDGAATTVSLLYDWTPTADTFYHLAADRSGNTWRLYIDGTMVASTTNATAIFNSTSTLTIGQLGTAAAMKGNIDELRITGGVARYASDSGFAVPTAAFPRS